MDEKDLKIAEIARLCDLPDSTVRTIITRKSKSVALDVAFKLSRGLSVPLDYLNGKTYDSPQTRDQVLLEKYHEANPVTQKNVDKLLDMPE